VNRCVRENRLAVGDKATRMVGVDMGDQDVGDVLRHDADCGETIPQPSAVAWPEELS
jgi:hypothetical protein